MADDVGTLEGEQGVYRVVMIFSNGSGQPAGVHLLWCHVDELTRLDGRFGGGDNVIYLNGFMDPESVTSAPGPLSLHFTLSTWLRMESRCCGMQEAKDLHARATRDQQAAEQGPGENPGRVLGRR